MKLPQTNVLTSVLDLKTSYTLAFILLSVLSKPKTIKGVRSQKLPKFCQADTAVQDRIVVVAVFVQSHFNIP